MKRVLSISLGSSNRDSIAEVEMLGERFVVERRGTDGSLKLFRRFMADNDGVVDCLCVGGTNLGLYCAGRYYRFREITALTRGVKRTPLVDGSGLKNTLERITLHRLREQGIVDLASAKVLLTCGIDRFGMAETLAEMGADVVYGDIMFNLELGIPIRTLRGLQRVGRALLPLMVRVPFKWLYPTGDKQDETVPRYGKWYDWADVIAGDFHYIRRYMPDDMSGKIVLTNTTTEADEVALTERGVRLLITSTPVIEGRAFATNAIEGMFVCLIGKRPEDIAPEEYIEMAERIGWEPTVRELNETAGGEVSS